MTHNTKLFAFFMMLALTILACGGSKDVPPAQDANILFKDDFSDVSSGWDRVQREGEAITDYLDQAYQIKVMTTNMDIWANPGGQTFSDVRIEVKASKVSGSTDNNDFGVICRYKNEANFYFFTISSDGYYMIGKVKDGNQGMIDMDSMLPSDTINLGDGVNQIRADCVGKTLTLYINEQKVAQREDKDFAEGNVGLIAGTFDDVYTEILFDDFTVKKP